MCVPITRASLAIKEKNVINIGRNNATIFKWMYDVRLEKSYERIFTVSPRLQ